MIAVSWCHARMAFAMALRCSVFSRTRSLASLSIRWSSSPSWRCRSSRSSSRAAVSSFRSSAMALQRTASSLAIDRCRSSASVPRRLRTSWHMDVASSARTWPWSKSARADSRIRSPASLILASLATSAACTICARLARSRSKSTCSLRPLLPARLASRSLASSWQAYSWMSLRFSAISCASLLLRSAEFRQRLQFSASSFEVSSLISAKASSSLSLWALCVRPSSLCTSENVLWWAWTMAWRSLSLRCSRPSRSPRWASESARSDASSWRRPWTSPPRPPSEADLSPFALSCLMSSKIPACQLRMVSNS
mmetsp:Transcript_26482/g.76214  ORF Transcript_26482/g.76214 Transcript_26482/m.76214 type:complete len:310 (+) Transcript_26482:130-1059(+)